MVGKPVLEVSIVELVGVKRWRREVDGRMCTQALICGTLAGNPPMETS